MRVFLGSLAGGVLGAALSLLGKCSSGMCPLTRDPATVTLVFAIIGAGIAAIISSKR